jgi:hypothetical protein
VLAAAGAGVWLAVLSEHEYVVRANLAVSGLALVVLTAGLVLNVAASVPLAIGLLGTEYVLILGVETDALDTRAPLVAGALLAVAELAYWSLELRASVVDEPGTYLRRIAVLASIVLGVVAIGIGALALVEVVSAGGVAIDILGAAAALGALALLALAARRTVS